MDMCVLKLGHIDINRLYFAIFGPILIIFSLMWREYRAHFYFIGVHYLYPNEMKIPKWSWRKMKKKIFNFFPGAFENSKFVPQDSLIFRKLKYVPMSAYYDFVREIWRIKEVLVYLFLTQFTCILAPKTGIPGAL